MIRYWARAAALGATAALIITACGSDESKSTTSPASSSGTEETTAGSTPSSTAGSDSGSDSTTGTSETVTGTETGFTLTTPAATGELESLRWGVAGSEPTSLDWIYNWDYGPSNLVQANLCEGLTRQNPDGTTSPALATAIDTPDDTTYVFTIRDGVTFTNGDPMTAADVAYSLNRNLDKALSSWWGLWYDKVESITVTGENEVTVKLTGPDALFKSVMSTPAGYVGEQSFIEAAGANYGSAEGGVMCTGPFSLESWQPGTSITLKRNDAYWDPALKPKAAQVVFSFVPDPSAMTSALLTGELDGSYGFDVSTINTLRDSDAGTVYLNEGTEVLGMQFNDLTQGPLSDVRIRQALRLAIDYQGIVAGILDGYGTPSKSSAPPQTFGYAAEAWQAGYDALVGGSQDLETAKALVEEAGAPADPIVIAVSADDQSIVNVVTTVQDAAESVGLKVEIRKMPASEYTNLFFDEAARVGINVMLSTVTVDTPDPLELMIQVIPGSPYNYTKMDDQELVDLLTEAVATADDTERATVASQAGKHINDNVYSISVYSLNTRLFMAEGVTGAPVASLSQWYYPWAATVGAL